MDIMKQIGKILPDDVLVVHTPVTLDQAKTIQDGAMSAFSQKGLDGVREFMDTTDFPFQLIEKA